MSSPKKIAFILYHSGETSALLPTIKAMAKQTDKFTISIIAIGQAAYDNLVNLAPNLQHLVVIPDLEKGLALNEEMNTEISLNDVKSVATLCEGYATIVIGKPAKAQQQIAHYLAKNSRSHIIVYFDAIAMPSAEEVKAFAPAVDTMMLTTELSVSGVKELLIAEGYTQLPLLVPARHGDFDVWLEKYSNCDKQAIRQALKVSMSAKIIGWAGSYGMREIQAFRLFANELSNNPELKETLTLRITLHPGVNNRPENEKTNFINQYYIQPLLDAGYSSSEITHVITDSPTNELSYVACGMCSSGSTTSAQTVYAHGRSITVKSIGDPVTITGIKSIALPEVEGAKKFSEKLLSWMSKPRRDCRSYDRAIAKLQIPAKSPYQVLSKI